MVNRKTDYQHRKDHILGIVVNHYIRTVNPVSSSFIAAEYGLDLSSATIRNILAELEQDGYLTHPHTSAGRLPTQEGYRYYVNYLMNEIQLLAEEKERIRAEYRQGLKDLEMTLEKTSQVISDLTHCTSIISVDNMPHRIFCKGTGYVVEYGDLTDTRRVAALLRLLEEKEQLFEIINRRLEEKIQIFIGHELACANMEECSLAISRYQTPNGFSGRIAVLGPTRMNYPKVVSALEYISGLMNEDM